jgi:hypothetical protein
MNIKNYMKNLFNQLLLIISFFAITSCTPGAPYEIKSPCVAIDSSHPYGHTPCARRPANKFFDIA